jgi:prepilin-type N-terminal cleavage/methylation domain-containing protein
MLRTGYARARLFVRRGMTLAEVLVALIVVAIVATFTIPAVMSRMTTGYGDALASELTTLAQGIQSYKTNVGRYPNRLDYLTLLPSSSPKDICSTALSALAIASWRGPYVSRIIAAPVGIPDAQPYVVNGDTIAKTLARTPAAQDNTTKNFVTISVSPLDSARAAVVKMAIDGQPLTSTTGNVSFTIITGESYGTLSYAVPVNGC